jgi:hypothetical protein
VLSIIDGNVLGAPPGWKIVGRGVSKTVEIGKRGRPAVCVCKHWLMRRASDAYLGFRQSGIWILVLFRLPLED